MANINCLVANIIHSIFFCVQQKKEIHIGWNKLRVSSLNYDIFYFFIFGWTIHLKIDSTPLA